MGLPLDNSCNAVFVCVDKLTKLVAWCPVLLGRESSLLLLQQDSFCTTLCTTLGSINRLFMTMTLDLLVLCGMLCLKYLVASYCIVLLIIPKWMVK